MSERSSEPRSLISLLLQLNQFLISLLLRLNQFFSGVECYITKSNEATPRKTNPIDAISSLPDCLLHHILSFLATKESIRTSVLSKRWINVWKSVPCLDLDASDFNQVENFENFVDSILRHKLFPNPEKLDTFNLTCRDTCHEESYEMINKWIYNLVNLKPRVVHVELPTFNKTRFFKYLFNCTSLESLFLRAQLYSGWDLNLVKINLPFLKSLHLAFLFLGDEFIQKLCLGCPVLEELVFDECYFNGAERISSSTVKKMRIQRPIFDDNTVLRVSIPSLVNLVCETPLGHLCFENLVSLEFASVTLMHIKDDYYDLDEDEVKLLRGLSNAKTIQLSGSSVEGMLAMETLMGLPVFEKLESLKFASFEINKNLEPINHLLKCAPNLEKLTLEFISVKEVEGLILSWVKVKPIECGKLKTVEIACSKRSDEEIHELVKSLLVHFKAIRNISITCINDV